MGLPLFVTPGAADVNEPVSGPIYNAPTIITEAQNTQRETETNLRVEFYRLLAETQSILERGRRERRERREQAPERGGSDEISARERSRNRSRDSMPSLIDEEDEDGTIADLGLDASSDNSAFALEPSSEHEGRAPREQIREQARVRVGMREEGRRSRSPRILRRDGNGLNIGQNESHLSAESGSRRMMLPDTQLTTLRDSMINDAIYNAELDVIGISRNDIPMVPRPLEERVANQQLTTRVANINRAGLLAENMPIEAISGSGREDFDLQDEIIMLDPTQSSQSLSRSLPQERLTRSNPDGETANSTILELPSVPQNNPALHRENPSSNTIGIYAGETVVDDVDIINIANRLREHIYSNATRRVELMTQMMNDIAIYDRARGREFGL